MIDGPYAGWKPTPQEWYRIKFGRVLYVDKDGFLSSTEINHGVRQKFRVNEGYNDRSPPTSEFLREAYAMGGPTGYGAIRPGDLPPTDFFMNSSSFSDSPPTSISSGFSEPGGPGTTNRINGINGVYNTGRDPSPILPVELMIYNDLMTDIEGTARVLGQEFQDSILFGPAPTSSPAPAGRYPDQGPRPQSPNTMYG